jgi:hypothetical protein
MSKLLKDQAGVIYPAIVGKLGTNQNLTAGATTAASSAFGQETTLIRVALSPLTGAGAHVHFAIGTTPVATTSTAFLPCGVIEYIAVAPGDKIALLRGGATSIDVSVCEITNS